MAQASLPVPSSSLETDPDAYEQDNVHAYVSWSAYNSVYDVIASHFSSTRYKVRLSAKAYTALATHSTLSGYFATGEYWRRLRMWKWKVPVLALSPGSAYQRRDAGHGGVRPLCTAGGPRASQCSRTARCDE